MDDKKVQDSTSGEEDVNQAHKEKMIAQQKAQREKIKQMREKKGLLIVLTGNGKGKSTSAFGTMIRAMGHGFNVGLVQFIKGNWKTGEGKALARFDDLLDHHIMGEGFTWNTQDRERDMATARQAWKQAVEMINDEKYKLIVLDELNIVLKYGYLPVEEVVETLKAKREMLHVIVTGRNAAEALIEAADLVSEVVPIKHPFQKGIKAQLGIEF